MADPFNPDPLKDKIREMIGRAKEFEDLNYFATSNSMCFLKGEKGVGKTFLIRKLIENLKKDYRILYIDANGFSKNKDIEKPIVTSKKIYEKIIRKKGFILIMDNCNTLTDRNLERIKYHYDKDFITSVVFSNSELPENESIQSRIGSRIIDLERFTPEQAYNIYLSRSEGDLSRVDIEELYEKSKNLKNFMEELRIMHSKNPELEYMKHEMDNKASDVCDSCGLRLEEVYGKWRCRRCDTYCTSCGEKVSKDDRECPRCMALFG